MMNKNINQAIILAAGYGKRLRPLTLKTPKPLILVNKKPIIFYLLEELRNNNIHKCFINVHYLPDQIINYIHQYSKQYKYMDIKIIKEKVILDTGGAIKNITKRFNNKPLIVINGDSIIISKNKIKSPLKILINNFNIKLMDYLLLLDTNQNSIGYKGNGDFNIKDNKNISMIDRSSEHNIAYTGWQIVNPKPIIKINKKIFSLNLCYNEAIKNKLLWGVLNKGKWLHIGTKKSLIESEKWIKSYKS